MDPLLLNKLLKFCGYENLDHTKLQNPLLEPEVSLALSKSLVKILKISNASSGSAVKKNLKSSVVENVRNLCRSQTCIEHKNILERTLKLYHLKYSCCENSNDNAFNDIEIFLSSESTLLPKNLCDEFVNDTILAILNISSQCYFANNILEQLILRNISSLNQNVVLKLWQRKQFSQATYDSLAILMIPTIEIILQEYCLKTLSSDTVEYNDEKFVDLISNSSKSPRCFQICCSILNEMLFITNFNKQILDIIKYFIENLKTFLFDWNISILYPIKYQKISFYLNIDFLSLKSTNNDFLIHNIFQLIHDVEENGSDFIMLMSHYPVWFKHYQIPR